MDDPRPQGLVYSDTHPRFEQLVRSGGWMKHTAMQERLAKAEEQGLSETERREGTQHCPTCSMHVTKNEAMVCLACAPLPDHAEVGNLLSPSGSQAGGITLYTPDWWPTTPPGTPDAS